MYTWNSLIKRKGNEKAINVHLTSFQKMRFTARTVHILKKKKDFELTDGAVKSKKKSFTVFFDPSPLDYVFDMLFLVIE